MMMSVTEVVRIVESKYRWIISHASGDFDLTLIARGLRYEQMIEL